VVLAGEAEIEVTRQGVQADRAIEGEVVRAPAYCLAGIGHRFRPAQVIGVEVVQLGGVADHRHRLTAQVHVLEVVALGRQELVLDPQPAVGLVAEPGLLAGAGALVGALAQGVDLVIGHDAVLRVLHQSVEAIVHIVVRAVVAALADPVAVGVEAIGAAEPTADAGQPIIGGGRAVGPADPRHRLRGAIAVGVVTKTLILRRGGHPGQPRQFVVTVGLGQTGVDAVVDLGDQVFVWPPAVTVRTRPRVS